MRADEGRVAGDEKPHAFVLPFVLFARALARRARPSPSTRSHTTRPPYNEGANLAALAPHPVVTRRRSGPRR